MLSTAFVILGAESVGLLGVHQKMHPPSGGLDTVGYDATVADFAQWGAAIQIEYAHQTDNGRSADGVFDYEVSEVFGQWLAEQVMENGEMPSHADAKAQLDDLIAGVMME